ncbi:MAG: ABC transporter permease subunit [Actinomycetota bacterium]
MNATALRLELRRSRTLVLWLGIVTAAYAGFITIFYTNVVENAEAFDDMLALYPKELMAAFGMEGSFADPGVFLGGYVYNFLWPLIAAMAAIVLATRIAADADKGFLDVALATPITRVAYLLGSIVTQVVGIAILAVSMVGAVLLGDLLIEPNFPATAVALSALHSLAFGVAVAGPATFLAVLFLDRGRAAGVAAAILILMYLLNVIGALAPEAESLTILSAFRYYDLKLLINEGTYPIVDSLIFVAVGSVGWLLALYAFRRRDLAA